MSLNAQVKNCSLDSTCIKKKTRDSCIRAFNRIKRITRDCRIEKNALKLKWDILDKKRKQEIALLEKRLSLTIKDLKGAAKRDKNKAFLTGVLIGVGGTLLLSATVTTLIFVYAK